MQAPLIAPSFIGLSLSLLVACGIEDYPESAVKDDTFDVNDDDKSEAIEPVVRDLTSEFDDHKTTSSLVNLALNRPATQSTTAFGGVASRAVDGNTDGDFGHGSVTHTNADAPYENWWQVDLEQVAPIGEIVVHNRTDCCGDLLANFLIEVSVDGMQWEEFINLGTALPQSRVRLDRLGRYVRIRNPFALHIAEVEVFSTDNLAYGKPATQSSTGFGGDPSRAVDGNTDGDFGHGSVSHSGPGPSWWQVDLEQVEPVGELMIHKRTDCCTEELDDFNILVSTDGVNWTTFTHDSHKKWSVYLATSEGEPIIRRSINRPVRYVRIETDNVLHLAEVQVFRTRNLAYGKPTTQSSTAFGGDSARAVDGNADGDFGHGSVSHTAAGQGNWWQVDLEAIHDLGKVRLFNRTDCCAAQLNNFKVRVSTNGSDWHDVDYSGSANKLVELRIDHPGRYIRIENGDGYLHLAEVQAFAGGIHWGEFERECVAGYASKLSATLWDIPAGQSWETACMNMSATLPSGVFRSRPDECVHTGQHMRGEFHFDSGYCNDACMPSVVTNEVCCNYGWDLYGCTSI